MKVMITGATGFVGQHVARRLIGSADVTVLARDPEKAHEMFGEQVEIVPGTFTDDKAIRQAMQGADVLYHIGARRDHWGLPRREYIESNVIGTRMLLSAARDLMVPKIVYCSTVGVYSYDFEYKPVDEAHPYGKHFSYYHESKMLAEEVVFASGLPVITVRPGWIYGPDDEWGGVTQMLLKLDKGRFAFVGSGNNRLHPVYIDDVVDGILAAGRSEQYGEAFLLLGPEALTFREYVNAMCRALDVAPPRLQLPYAAGVLASYVLEPAWLLKNRLIGRQALGDKPPMTRDTLHGVSADRVYDTSKATRLLGHTPRIGVEEGLRRTVEWLEDSGRLPRRVRREQPASTNGASEPQAAPEYDEARQR